MLRLSFFTLILGISVGMLVPSDGSAWSFFGGHHRKHAGHPPDHLIAEHAEELGLDEGQQEELRELLEDSRENGEELQEEVHERKEEMRELLSEESPDEGDVMRKAEAIGQAEIAAHKNRLSTMLKIRALLNPEQREKLSALRESMRGKYSHSRKEACKDDLAKLCPEASGRWDRVRCLHEHKNDLSEQCNEGIRSGHRKHHRGRHHGDDD